MKKIVLLFGILMAFGYSALAWNMANGSTTLTCNSSPLTFLDNGGTGNYGRSQNLTHTFRSPEGTRIRIRFSKVRFNQTHASLSLYSGPNTSSTPTSVANGTGTEYVSTQVFISDGNVCVTVCQCVCTISGKAWRTVWIIVQYFLQRYDES